MLISDTRSKLAGSIGSLLSEKYSRAYRAMVTMQVLAEMEEVVDYKRVVDRALANEKEATKNSASDLATNLVDNNHLRTPAARLAEDAGMKFVPGVVDINAKKYNLILKWRGRLESAPKEVDVYRQILVSTMMDVHSFIDSDAS
jgi:hypothetical protein